MGRYKQPYSLYSRKMKNGQKVYYYRTYDEDGNRTSGISTGQTTLSAARSYCDKLWKKDELVPKKSTTFVELAEDFWVWGKCKYIARANTYGKKTISPDHAYTERGYLVNRILPYFRNYKLTSIKRNRQINRTLKKIGGIMITQYSRVKDHSNLYHP